IGRRVPGRCCGRALSSLFDCQRRAARGAHPDAHARACLKSVVEVMFPRLPFMRIEFLESRLLLSAGLFAFDQDIGSPPQPGSSAYSNGAYMIVGGGAGALGSNDQFHFTYQSFSGDAVIIARVTSLTNTSTSAQAGVMFRSGTAANAA